MLLVSANVWNHSEKSEKSRSHFFNHADYKRIMSGKEELLIKIKIFWPCEDLHFLQLDSSCNERSPSAAIPVIGSFQSQNGRNWCRFEKRDNPSDPGSCPGTGTGTKTSGYHPRPLKGLVSPFSSDLGYRFVPWQDMFSFNDGIVFCLDPLAVVPKGNADEAFDEFKGRECLHPCKIRESFGT